MQGLQPWSPLGQVLVGPAIDLAYFVEASLRLRPALAAETLCLRKQLALDRERQVTPRRAPDLLRLTLDLLARCFTWHEALTIVRPATRLRWHRETLRLLWRWRSRPGRPRMSPEHQRLIAVIARDNPTWGEERIAADLLLTLGIRVSPRTVRRYMGQGRGGRGARCRANRQRWAKFVRNHAQVLLACEFCVVVIATFRLLYLLVALEMGSRRLLHITAPANPTAAGTLQRVREILGGPHQHQFVLHDRDRIYSVRPVAAVAAMGVRVLRTPVQAPLARAYCERLLGTLRRECLDFLIPFGEDHLRRLLRVWQVHYYRGRPYASLGPGLPAPSRRLPAAPIAGHDLPRDTRVVARSILGGLHDEYGLQKLAA